jgi:hypothetical protein
MPAAVRNQVATAADIASNGKRRSCDAWNTDHTDSELVAMENRRGNWASTCSKAQLRMNVYVLLAGSVNARVGSRKVIYKSSSAPNSSSRFALSVTTNSKISAATDHGFLTISAPVK